MNFNGYKTYIGAAIIALSAGLDVLGYGQYSQVLMMIGSTLGLVGVRHAIEKSKS